MTGLDLARELALLGAAEGPRSPLLAGPAGQASAPPGASSLVGGRWAELGRRMAAHLDIPDATQESLCGDLALSPSGYWLVMLCGAAEIFPDVAQAMGAMAADPRLGLPTPALFAGLLAAAQDVPYTHALREALLQAGSERLGLIARVPTDAALPASQQPLRLTLGVLAALLGGGVGAGAGLALFPRVDAHREEPAAAAGLPDAAVAAAAAVLAERGVLCIRGATARSGRQLALDVASRRGESALLLAAQDTLPDAAELGRLRGALPVLDLWAYVSRHPFPAAYLRSVGDLLPELVVVVPRSAATEAMPTVDVGALTYADSRRIWTLALDDAAAGATLGNRYRASLEEARSAVRAARARDRGDPAHDGPPSLAAIGREICAQGARRLDGLVPCLRPEAPLPPLVLSPAARAQVDRIIAWQRALPTLATTWGLATRGEAPQALICLLQGPAGTGKTLTACHIAEALGQNLFRIDLDFLLAGQEGRLAQLVRRAEAGHGILLIDDVDAFLGTDAGRWAALRQRLASFVGVVLFAARAAPAPEIAQALDVVVELDVPEVAARRQMWEAALPDRHRRAADVDVGALAAALPLSGGAIAAAVRAAASAAGALGAEVVGMAELMPAARQALQRHGA